MSISTGRVKLHEAMKTLECHWQETSVHWQDAARKDFEEASLALLRPQVVAGLGAMDRLAQVLAQLRNECS